MFGKATYAVPDSQTNPYCGAGIRKCGNFTLSISAQDIAEPGKNADKFKFKLMPPSGNTPVFDTSYIVIAGGNVQVPHSSPWVTDEGREGRRKAPLRPSSRRARGPGGRPTMT